MKSLLFKRKREFVIYLIGCFLPAVNQLMGNFGFALLIGSVQARSTEILMKTTAVAVIIVVVSSLFQLLSRFMRIGYMRDTILDVRLQAFDKILAYDVHHFNKKSKDAYVSNLVNDINIFEQQFFHRLLNVIFRGGVYVLSVLILLFMDTLFAITIFVLSWVIFWLTKKFENRTVSLQEQVSAENESFTLKASNVFNGAELLKLNNVEDRFLEQTLSSVDAVERKRFKYTVFTEGQRSLTNTLSFGIFIGMLAYLIALGFQGVSIGKITLMLQLGFGCVWPIGQVMPMFNELKASARIFEKITSVEKYDTTDERDKASFSFENAIKVERVDFSYESVKTLNNLNFTLKPGKKYLIRGTSGSGKSTLMKVLAKIVDEYEGSITMDGVDLRQISEKSFNENVSFIYQDVFLFEDTIRNNITLYKNYTQESVYDAIEKAGLNEFVNEHSDGLERMLEENGKNLSGGQRQRISIARAILRNTQILFSDEATASLNQELGKAVENTLLSLEQTVISISHRFYEGVTENYDFVLEMKNGTLIEYPGTVYFKEALT